jgi:hypothetical protein
MRIDTEVFALELPRIFQRLFDLAPEASWDKRAKDLDQAGLAESPRRELVPCRLVRQGSFSRKSECGFTVLSVLVVVSLNNRRVISKYSMIRRPRVLWVSPMRPNKNPH